MKNSVKKSKYWKAQIEACHCSGMSLKAWSDENGVSYSSLLYWTHKFKQEGDSCKSEMPVFATVPQAVFSTVHSDDAITIRLPGMAVEIANHCDEKLLCSLVNLLVPHVCL